ncbi:MAG: HD domain-containing protein [bacterium]|nr:HD domain-containing protein [bacterium]
MKTISLLKDILLSDDIEKHQDILFNLIPELKHMVNFAHNHPHHHLDVWEHTLLAIKKSEKIFLVRLVLLLHDIGKPFSFQDEEVRHFRNHALVSSLLARDILQRLKFATNDIEKIIYIIKNHDTIIDSINNYEVEQIRLLVQYADALAHHPDKQAKRLKILNEVKNNLFNTRN